MKVRHKFSVQMYCFTADSDTEQYSITKENWEGTVHPNYYESKPSGDGKGTRTIVAIPGIKPTANCPDPAGQAKKANDRMNTFANKHLVRTRKYDLICSNCTYKRYMYYTRDGEYKPVGCHGLKIMQMAHTSTFAGIWNQPIN